LGWGGGLERERVIYRKSRTSIIWLKICGSNVFQGYFDDSKESRVKQNSRIQESRFKF